jgi:branched-chain amino acid transport system substrate-binding protein
MNAVRMKLQSEASYVRNTLAVEDAVPIIARGQPEAIVMIGTYSALAKFVQLVKTNTTLYPNAANILFLTVSFVGSEAYAPQLGSYYQNNIISQVVPGPTDRRYKLIRDYQAALQAAAPGTATSYVSLEGYLVGKFISMALKGAASLTRSSFVQNIYDYAKFYMGGITAGPFSDCTTDIQQYPINSDVCGCNSGLRQVWLVSRLFSCFHIVVCHSSEQYF